MRTRPARLPATLAAALALGAGSLLAACAPDEQGGAGDAPIAAVEREPWVIINNVDGFPNIATRCRGTTGLYVTRSAGDNSDTLQVVVDDPACASGGATTGTSVPR